MPAQLLTIVPANEASWDTSRVLWSGRDEDKGDDGIWAVTCFVVRKGFRGRGLTHPGSSQSRV